MFSDSKELVVSLVRQLNQTVHRFLTRRFQRTTILSTVKKAVSRNCQKVVPWTFFDYSEPAPESVLGLKNTVPVLVKVVPRNRSKSRTKSRQKRGSLWFSVLGPVSILPPDSDKAAFSCIPMQYNAIHLFKIKFLLLTLVYSHIIMMYRTNFGRGSPEKSTRKYETPAY